ncbi:hypothetical protein NKT34_09945 [Paenibacillus polysaccharolyticus]|uniref:hypothetical protein n=1 Tax=Paenibacillus polysaccharolyticus TaxID=582692 RepID=UPI00209EF8B8|nr:hypothetical protein [Paenibacillus polysaccharolyticus]MCP1133613.1 hypothetical protein [Paenibacillus polysaccharolyticus]
MGKSKNQFNEQHLSNIKRRFYDKITKAELEPNVLSKLSLSRRKQTQKSIINRRRYRKFIYIPVTVALSLCIFTGAAAAIGILDLTSVLHFLGVDRIAILQPVHQESEDQGIHVEVIGAVRDGDTTEVYVSVSDLISNRIDENLDVYDYRLTGGKASNAQIIYYDRAAKTAIVRFVTQGKVSTNRMTVRINTLMSGAARKDGYPVPVDWNSLLQQKEKNSYEMLNSDQISGLGGEIANGMDKDSFQVLRKDQTNIAVQGVNWMYISNIGFVNGKLHVQINPDNEVGGYNHGFFYFIDEQGHRLDIPENSISYGYYMKDDVGYGGDYIEYIYDLSSVKALNKLKLQGSFTNIGEVIQGKWETSFNLNQLNKSKRGHVNLGKNSGTQVEATLSPIGITLTGEALGMIRMEDLKIELQLKDGTKMSALTGFIQLHNDLVKWISSKTIRVEDVSNLVINGQKVNLEE